LVDGGRGAVLVGGPVVRGDGDIRCGEWKWGKADSDVSSLEGE